MPYSDSHFEQLCKALGIPEDFWSKKSVEYRYWFRSLLQKVDSSLIFKGIPETWSEDFYKFCLWYFGFVSVFNTERWGTAFQPVTISGYDFYYQPTKALVANPLYQKELTIHKDCELIKLTPDFRGIWDIINQYATKLANLSISIDMGIENAKVPMIFNARNQAQAETLKRIHNKVTNGESLIVYDNTDDEFDEVIPIKEGFENWTNDFKSTYIVTNLLQDMQTILNQFYMEIGLPTTIEKKTHILNSEADFQSAQSQARLACWVQSLNESYNLVNKRFGMELSVDFANMDDDTVGDNTESITEDEQPKGFKKLFKRGE